MQAPRQAPPAGTARLQRLVTMYLPKGALLMQDRATSLQDVAQVTPYEELLQAPRQAPPASKYLVCGAAPGPNAEG